MPVNTHLSIQKISIENISDCILSFAEEPHGFRKNKLPKAMIPCLHILLLQISEGLSLSIGTCIPCSGMSISNVTFPTQTNSCQENPCLENISKIFSGDVKHGLEDRILNHPDTDKLVI